MSFKGIVRELKEMKDGIGTMSRRVGEGKHWRSRSYRSQTSIAPDEVKASPISTTTRPSSSSSSSVLTESQSQWTNLPPELLFDILRRVEESEASWPARAVVVFCALVCRSWRHIINEIVKTPEQCGRLTFPISLKQPGPRESPIQCFIKRDRANLTYFLYLGLVPSEGHKDKALLAAKRIRRATGTDFVISLASDEFSRASTNYVGKLRSNFLGTKFTIYDSQPPYDHAPPTSNRASRRFHSRQVSPRVPACHYGVGGVSYELNVLRTRGPRRLNCAMTSIPLSSVQPGGTTFTPTNTTSTPFEGLGPKDKEKEKEKEREEEEGESLALKNKAPRWHEQLQCWCLNFKGRVTVASVKNFQLVAAVEPEQERVILQFGKIGKDIFTMDYAYPISAFQAFAICLSSFDTKPACE